MRKWVLLGVLVRLSLSFSGDILGPRPHWDHPHDQQSMTGRGSGLGRGGYEFRVALSPLLSRPRDSSSFEIG